METLQIILSSGVGAGIMAIVLAALQRYWRKKDGKDDALIAIVDAQKVIIVDRVRDLTQRYIEDGGITLEEKETVQEFFITYRRLGGNGHLDAAMAIINNLPVITK